MAIASDRVGRKHVPRSMDTAGAGVGQGGNVGSVWAWGQAKALEATF